MVSIEIVSTERIKPSSPTPENLRYFKLSFIDQTAPAMYTGILLFYTGNNVEAAKTSEKLKESLSKMLTGLYPLAGTINDQTTIECNDKGARYIEARVKCSLSEILQKPDSLFLRNLFAVDSESKQAEKGSLLFVQANFFDCGGIAIGVSISHKIADAATLGIVIKSWSKVACDLTFIPSFHTSTHLYPSIDLWTPPMMMNVQECVTKRYVFDASKIAELKVRVASENVPQPTRVEAVTSLLWKCTMNVSNSNKGIPRLAVVGQAVNIRNRLAPPLPENTIGNNVGICFATHSTETKIELQGLVCKLKKEILQFTESDLIKIINVEKKTWLNNCGIPNLYERDDVDFFLYTSWCRFPFYEADFGWGKPIWLTLSSVILKNTVLLLDTRDGKGMEAIVTMGKEDMITFENDPELLQFSIVNPSVLNED